MARPRRLAAARAGLCPGCRGGGRPEPSAGHAARVLAGRGRDAGDVRLCRLRRRQPGAERPLAQRGRKLSRARVVDLRHALGHAVADRGLRAVLGDVPGGRRPGHGRCRRGPGPHVRQPARHRLGCEPDGLAKAGSFGQGRADRGLPAAASSRGRGRRGAGPGRGPLDGVARPRGDLPDARARGHGPVPRRHVAASGLGLALAGADLAGLDDWPGGPRPRNGLELPGAGRTAVAGGFAFPCHAGRGGRAGAGALDAAPGRRAAWQRGAPRVHRAAGAHGLALLRAGAAAAAVCLGPRGEHAVAGLVPVLALRRVAGGRLDHSVGRHDGRPPGRAGGGHGGCHHRLAGAAELGRSVLARAL